MVFQGSMGWRSAFLVHLAARAMVLVSMKQYSQSRQISKAPISVKCAICVSLDEYSLIDVNLYHHAPNAIHSPLHIPLDLKPIRAPFRKLIDLLSAKDAMKPIPIGNDCRHLLRIRRVNEVDL